MACCCKFNMLNNLVAFCQSRCPAGRRHDWPRRRLAGRRCVKSGTHSGTTLPRVTVGARAGHTGSRDTFLALRFALHAKGEELVKLGIIFRGKQQLYTTRTKGGGDRRPAAYRRPVPSTEPNTVLPVHFSARPSFTAEERELSGQFVYKPSQPKWPTA